MQREVVLSHLCDEPKGDVLREVWRFTFLPENIQRLYEKVKQYPVLFGRELSSAQEFLDFFLRYDSSGQPEGTGLIYIVDDFVGAFYITDIFEDQAEVHYSFFDGRFRGRIGLTKEMLRWVFKTYRFDRLNARIPKHVGPKPFEFARKVGFVAEGCAREGVKWKDSRSDVICLGILRRESLENGSEN